MRKAFTLIELMVICAIIAIVIGMVLPVIRVAREEAKALKEKEHADFVNSKMQERNTRAH